MNFVSKVSAFVLMGSLAFALSCETYEPPPELRLVQPPDGAFNPGDPLTLEFTKKINRDTFRVTIWPDVRDIENEIPPDADPLVDACDRASSPCGDLTLEFAEDRLSVTLSFDPEGIGAAGLPMILEVLPGLEDLDGNATGVSTQRDFQFRGGEQMNQDPVEFDSGTYIVVGSVREPVPAILTLISDVKVAPSGEFRLAGSEGDPIDNDTPKNTSDPTKLQVDTEDSGWTAHVTGFIRLEDGQRLLETEPVQINLPLGPLTVSLEDVRLFGEIVKNADGFDRIEGTLSFSELVLVNRDRATSYDGDAVAVSADFVPPELAPEGHPVVCEDLCGAVVGLCEPPTDFPGETFCEEFEAGVPEEE